MLDEINDIQARIADIQSRLAALAPPTPPSPPPAGTASFGQALAQAQAPPMSSPTPPMSSPAPALDGPPIGRGTPPVTTLDGQTIHVPPASLGPLPPMPVAPTDVVPLPAQAASVESLIQTYAARHNLPTGLVKAVIQTESGGNPRAVSRAGAMGLMQLMPANVREAGISDPFDPEQNIAAGTRQLADLMGQYHGDLDLALAGYNAGPGNVRRYGGVPPFAETQNYIRKIRAAMEKG